MLRPTLVVLLAALASCGGSGAVAPPPAPAPPPPAPPAPTPVASISIAFPTTQLMVGQTAQGIATVKDAAGNVLGGRVVSWSSDNPQVAQAFVISGLVSGLAIGDAVVRAASEGRVAEANFSVTAPTSFGNGTRLVGTTVGPGLYRSNTAAGSACYWARLANFTGDILGNDQGGGPRVAEITASDAGFSSSNCATWNVVAGPVTTSPTAPFAEGVFIVGSDVAAGTWQSSGTGPGCSWIRLRNFLRKNDQIASFAGNGPAVVTIATNDAGFEAHGCGTWTKQ